MSVPQESQQDSGTKQNAGPQAAIARTLTRGLALYFSRPVRLFRPSKISGWQSLRNLAERQGAIYDHKFFLSVVKLQGFGIFSKHFFPPLAVNALLGTVLWTTYAKTYSITEPTLRNHPVISAAISGGIAGGTQALVAAPVENVRLVIEGGTSGHTWTQAWRTLISCNPQVMAESRVTQLHDAREFRKWIRDVGEMAGRGWNGWGWGCVKDICAFSAFFAIFEVTKEAGQAAKAYSEDFIANVDVSGGRFNSIGQSTPRMLNSVILVSGGVFAGLVYEFICRPWDKARRLVHLAGLKGHPRRLRTVCEAVRAEGASSFFRNPDYKLSDNNGFRLKLKNIARTLGRVGPWGIGFLVWEMYGVGLS